MIKTLRLLVVSTLMAMTLAAMAGGASAQTPAAQGAAEVPSETQEQIATAVDKLAAEIKGIEQQFDSPNVSQASLNALGVEVAPLMIQAQGLVERITPRTVALKARLDQLGAKAEGESPDVTKQREAMQKTFDQNDGLLKRAKTLEVQAQQDQTYIGKRQRTLFTGSLFQRSWSVLSPPLWTAVAKQTPGNIADVKRVFDEWVAGFKRNLTDEKLIAFWVLILAAVVLHVPLTRMARRVIHHESKVQKPTIWQKIVVACWTSFSVAGVIVAIMYCIVYVCSFFVPFDPTLASLYSEMQFGIIRIAVATGLSRGVLAPGRSAWRLVNLDGKTCDKLIRIIIGVASIVSVSKVIEALNEVIQADYRFSVATQAVGALLVAFAIAAALINLGDDPEADNPDSREDDSAPPTQRRDYYGVIRGGTWTLIVGLTIAVVVGYIAFATFLVDQIVLVAGIAALLFLLIRLIDKACELGIRPTSFVGRNLIHMVGMRRETLGQLSILLSGAARLVLIGFAMIVLVAQWGLQSTDIAGNIHAIFFGFKIGDVTISIEGIVVAIVSFLLVLAATRALQSWLEDRYLPQTRLDSGLRNSIKTSLGYVGFLLGLTLAAANLGVDFQKLAIVAGALSVGIGFGLQSIVNNFVSGLILLWERAVRVGDWVVVGADQGYVRKINVRSTEIETFDRASVIVPNSNLVSGVVKNLMRTDRMGRLTIEISVHAIADPEKVREVLIGIARDHEGIVSLPSPQVRFINLTASAMTFDLFCFVADVEGMIRTKSDLYFEICKQFRQYGFFDGPPPDPMGITIVGMDRIEGILQANRGAGSEPPARARKTG